MESNKPQIAVAQLGVRIHYAVPVLLQRAGMLDRFYTDIYTGRGSLCHALSAATYLLPRAWQPQSLRRLLSRRADDLPPEKVKAFNLFGLSYVLARKRAGNVEKLYEIYGKYGTRFCRLVMDNWSNGADGVYAFEGGAYLLFQRLNELKVTKILEKFIAPFRQEHELLSEENRRWPGWEPPYPGEDGFRHRFALQQEEWDGADAILCPSDFVAEGLALQGVSEGKLHIVPYGVEVEQYVVMRKSGRRHRPLHVLFVGAVTLRKGPQYLHKALKKLNPAKFSARMVGPVVIKEPYSGLLGERIELTGRLAHQEVRNHYRWADVFVFPSLCEGSATVIYEALASGLPVITTPNSGSVVRDGVDGFVVPIRDAEAIADRLEILAENSDLLAQMAENARDRAQEFSWEKYGERMISTIYKIMSDKVIA
jgi:glycosyltransferase involved in cell wall biosynthesis